MAKIIESVPNFSEGRDTAIIEVIVDVVRHTPGATLLNYSSDTNHNRTVVTYVGSPEAVESASVELAKKAVELIDMTKHTGEHPRMGAVDVMPFIPIKDTDMAECVELSKRVGAAIYEACGLPVFLYEQSASAPIRENLATIRKGQFEGMAKKMQKPEWSPDFGEPTPHPTGGVVAVGARMPLVAFNINLSTSDIKIADSIAKTIRRSGGGLECVKAIGIMLESRNIAQVSINMTDFNKTPLYRVVEFVRFEAARYGVNIVGTELIGLAPMFALIDSAEYYLQIEDFNRDQILEGRLL